MTKKSKLKIELKGKSYDIRDSPFFRLRSKKKLSSLFNLTLPQLQELKSDIGNYAEFEDVGKTGKARKIQKPNLELDKVHTKIASYLSRIKTPDFLHSGKKYHSNITNAKAHLDSTNLMVTDIKSFFPSTKKNMIFSFFYSVMECSSDVADLLAQLCSIHGFLPTGSRISMPLAYWANCRMFNELDTLSRSHGITMTVYVDDLTFSGENINRLFKAVVNKVISKHGHTMHPSKTKIYSAKQPKLVTGVIVKDNELKVRNEQHQKLYADLEFWKLIKDSPLTKNAKISSQLLGRLYSMGFIEQKFKQKALTIKSALNS
ncbi:reverse transcriptase family protein [Aliivibrio fischeri]|uniref:reverse transcriptase family protein n=1 Tax=Aliivibrio fischeri TaxID=668 RepID=UPI0007C5883B|nr:reverse transcriptase family protein [Aliivibrio fischeri]